jgi:hypothetical protein
MSENKRIFESKISNARRGSALFSCLEWWRRLDSNQRSRDYESAHCVRSLQRFLDGTSKTG